MHLLNATLRRAGMQGAGGTALFEDHCVRLDFGTAVFMRGDENYSIFTATASSWPSYSSLVELRRSRRYRSMTDNLAGYGLMHPPDIAD